MNAQKKKATEGEAILSAIYAISSRAAGGHRQAFRTKRMKPSLTATFTRSSLCIKNTNITCGGQRNWAAAADVRKSLIQKGGRNVSSTTILSAMVITCLVIVVLVALAKPLQGLFRFLLSGIFGSALLFLLGRLGFAP